MMYCPNAQCPERQLVGPPSEYADGVHSCPICGAPLVTAPPVFPPEPTVPGPKKEPDGKGLRYWREYRSRRRWYWVSFFAFIPYALILFTVIDAYPRLPSESIIVLGLCLYLGVSSVPSVRFLRWRCPRCGKPFHMRWLLSWPYGRACLHCKLQLWERVEHAHAA